MGSGVGLPGVYVGTNVGFVVGVEEGEVVGSGVGFPFVYVGLDVGGIVGKCVGYAAFGKLEEPVLSGIVHDLVKPHAQLLPAYQKRGITKAFYLSMLHGGYSLATESHTLSAAKLWDSLASELHIPIMNWDRRKCEFVERPSASSLKVLTIDDLE